MKRFIGVLLFIALVFPACSQPTPEIVKETVIVRVTEPPAPTHTPYPTYTSVPPAATYTIAPTYTPYPTYTQPPAPTGTPHPTSTPRPTSTATPLPAPAVEIGEPITLTGSGNDVVDVDKSAIGALAHITGNADGRHFSITSYDASGETLDLLVNTTEPYDGVRPLDFPDDDHTTRFEIKAVGDWTIEIIPLDPNLFPERVIQVPASYSGHGDDVFFTLGECDTATITGNADERYFGVFAWHSTGRNLLVNTTDPFDGTVIVPRDAFAIEVVAVGPWTIDIAVP